MLLLLSSELNGAIYSQTYIEPICCYKNRNQRHMIDRQSLVVLSELFQIQGDLYPAVSKSNFQTLCQYNSWSREYIFFVRSPPHLQFSKFCSQFGFYFLILSHDSLILLVTHKHDNIRCDHVGHFCTFGRTRVNMARSLLFLSSRFILILLLCYSLSPISIWQNQIPSGESLFLSLKLDSRVFPSKRE